MRQVDLQHVIRHTYNNSSSERTPTQQRCGPGPKCLSETMNILLFIQTWETFSLKPGILPKTRFFVTIWGALESKAQRKACRNQNERDWENTGKSLLPLLCLVLADPPSLNRIILLIPRFLLTCPTHCCCIGILIQHAWVVSSDYLTSFRIFQNYHPF